MTPGGLAVQARLRRSKATRRLGERPPESKRMERKSTANVTEPFTKILNGKIDAIKNAENLKIYKET